MVSISPWKQVRILAKSGWTRLSVLAVVTLAGVWLLLRGNITGFHFGNEEMQKVFEAYSPREADAIEEVACAGVGKLEQFVDEAIQRSAASAAREVLPSYIEQLSSYRHAVSKTYAGENARCRTEQLALMLNEEGKALAQRWRPSKDRTPDQATWGQYVGLMQGLANSMNDLKQCRRFWTVGTWIWQWGNSGDFRVLDNNPDAASRLVPAIELGAYYGHPAVHRSRLQGHGSLKMERVQHAQHLLVLELAAGVNVQTDLDQMVEFGGGTGDMCALVRDAGYPGLYIVYDMEPMTLLQLYWLRYSGHAAFLSKHMQNVPELKTDKTILQPAEDMAGFRKLLSNEPNAALRSAFVSFWAFNEADVDAREKIRPEIQHFGHILMAIQFNREGRYGWEELEPGKVGVDVASYFKRFVEDHLLKTHNTCMWHYRAWDNDFPAGGYYFVAARKELQPPRCLKSLNCDSSTKHPSIPSTC